MKQSTLELNLRLAREGTLVLSAESLASLGLKPGAPVHVRVTAPDIAADLENRGIAFDEIERIAAMQAEATENVMRFLRAEGALRRESVTRTPGRRKAGKPRG